MFDIPIALYLLQDSLYFESSVKGTCVRWNLSTTEGKTKAHWLQQNQKFSDYKLNLLVCYIALVFTVYFASLEDYRILYYQEELFTLIQPHWLLHVFDYLALQKKHHTLKVYIPFSAYAHPLYWEFTITVFWFPVSSDI